MTFEKNHQVIRLLPVAIMAHNEEKVIQSAIESVLSQNSPKNYSIKIFVVANGCNDRTEELVKTMQRDNRDNIELLHIEEKGKTKAINTFIKYINEISENYLPVPFVIFLDADCGLAEKDLLINFIIKFEQESQLCAIGANCIPDVLFNTRNDIVAEIYRGIYKLAEVLKINSISGMCYGIRLDVLKRIAFPEIQFAEDMFISARLDGWFMRDRNISIIFKTPSHLDAEIKRRTRQEISSQRYHQYYAYLIKNGVKVKLFDGFLSPDYRWGKRRDINIINAWCQVRGLKLKLCIIFHAFIRLLSRIKAVRILKKLNKYKEFDYWNTVR